MSFFSNIKLIAEFLDIAPENQIEFEPTWHQVAQAFGNWPIVINEDGYKMKLFEWGVIADYMNTPEKIKDYRTSMANARSEKLTGDKRSVWYRLRKNRCLVFTTGFFEHRDIGAKKKLPYFIKVKGQEIFCFAGLYNYSPLPDPETGEMTGTFAIITRPANELMATIHNAGANSGRMPVILTPDMAKEWLNPELDDTAIEKIVNFEWPSGNLEAWPVNTIRTRKENNAGVIEKISAPGFEF